MAMGREQRLVKATVDSVSDMRFNKNLFARLAAEQPDGIVSLEAEAFLTFFEMLAIRYEVGDVTPDMLPLLRLSKKIRNLWMEAQDN
jgi:hypothetical protein